MNKKLWIGIVVIIAIISISVAITPKKKVKTTTTTNTVVTEVKPNQQLALSDFAFTPKEFTVGASQTIKVLLKNTGKAVHTFTFDKLDFTSGSIEPGQSKTVTFTTPSTKGRYDFHCATTGHKDKGMTGTMIVQ